MKPGRTTQPPIYFRLPKPGTQDQWFGGTRTFWNELVLPTKKNNFKPKVKSVVDRKAGNVRGIRFISFESAMHYFQSLETT